MTDRDQTPIAESTTRPEMAAQAAPFKALNQSHWRAVEALLEGLREGRSLLVLTGERGAGPAASIREAIACLPKRMIAVQGRPQDGGQEAVIAPLHSALCHGVVGLEMEERPSDQLRIALERLASEDRGVVYFVDPQAPLNDEALVFLARLAASGRRLTRERSIAREEADQPLRGPVGAQIVLCAPREALPVLIDLGDGAMRRAAEDPIEIELFDGPALRAAFRQYSGDVMAPAAVEFALAATGGDHELLERLLGHPILSRAAEGRAAEAEPRVVTAQAAARAAEAIGLEAPAGFDPSELDAEDVRIEARKTTPTAPTQEQPEQKPSEKKDRTQEVEDAPLAEAPLDEASAEETAEPAEADQERALDAAEQVLADQDLAEQDLAEQVLAEQVLAEMILAEDASAARDGFEEDLPENDALDTPCEDDVALAIDEDEIEAILEENLYSAAVLEENAAEQGAPCAVEAGAEACEQSRPNAAPGEEEVKGALDAAERSLEPEAMERAGADPAPAAKGAVGVLAALVAPRPTAAERLRLPTAKPARTLGATRRHTLVLASIGVCILAAAFAGAPHLGLQGYGALLFGQGSSVYETGDARPPQELTGPEDGAGAIFNDMMRGALETAEGLARGAAETVAPTEGATRGMTRLADSLFSAREDLERSAVEEELANLPPEMAKMRREEQIADALRRAEDHVSAGRFTAPEGKNGYEMLLQAYRLAPQDPRVRGALAGLVKHYEKQAASALEDERYEAFHGFNRIADRIRGRMPI